MRKRNIIIFLLQIRERGAKREGVQRLKVCVFVCVCVSKTNKSGRGANIH